jgi:pseudaminic acid cytidylyltransferase
MNNVLIIPARSGSKRIPNKNKKDFLGVPMIERAIVLSKQAGVFSSIVVSTDDEEIVEISNRNGVEVTQKRPDVLSDDYATTLDVMAYETARLQENLQFTEISSISCLYPCTPLLTENLMQQALNLFFKYNSGYVFLAKETGIAFERTFTLDNNQRIDSEMKMEKMRSQDAHHRYMDAGQFYVGRPSDWLEKKAIFTRDAVAYVIEQYETIDVDTMSDWEIAEQLFLARKKFTNTSGDQ